jgi:hypothetical protein
VLRSIARSSLRRSDRLGWIASASWHRWTTSWGLASLHACRVPRGRLCASTAGRGCRHVCSHAAPMHCKCPTRSTSSTGMAKTARCQSSRSLDTPPPLPTTRGFQTPSSSAASRSRAARGTFAFDST